MVAANTIKSRLVVICPLIVTMLALGGDVPAQSYWGAIFELGFDPMIQRVNRDSACERIERIDQLIGLVSDHLKADEDLLRRIRELRSRATSLDVGNLYELLTYADAHGMWRGIGIRGGSNSHEYRLYLANPEVEDWVHSSADIRHGPWGHQEKFGDIGLRAFMRPTREDTFEFAAEGLLYLDDLPAANVIRAISAMVTTGWAHAARGIDPPVDFLHENSLNRESLNTLLGLSRDFPHLFRIVWQYFEIENVVSPKLQGADDFVLFEIRARFNREALALHYPELGKALEELKDMVCFRARIFDKQDRLMGTVALDTARNLFTMQFLTLNGRFIPIRDHWVAKEATGFSLTDSGHTQFRIMYDIHLNIVGLHLDIEGLQIVLDYSYREHGPNLEACLQQSPETIKASGHAFGFIPIWLVDLLIPSNVERITADFFQTLATGNDGQGAKIRLAGLSHDPLNEYLWLVADAEVLANGTMRLGLNLQRKIFAAPKELSAEMREFLNRLWNAFYQDYEGINVKKSAIE